MLAIVQVLIHGGLRLFPEIYLDPAARLGVAGYRRTTMSASETVLATTVDIVARARARIGIGHSWRATMPVPSPNIAAASNRVVTSDATSSTPCDKTPVDRTATATKKPTKNSGTTGPLLLAPGARHRRADTNCTGTSRTTRASFTVVAAASAVAVPAPMSEAAATTWATSW